MEPARLRRRAIVAIVASAVLMVAALVVLDPVYYGPRALLQAMRYAALAASAVALAVGLALFYRADRRERRP
jgi:hypothetical protein